MSFFVPGRPFSKRRPRVGRGAVYTHPETVAAEKAVAWYARRAMSDRPPLAGAVALGCVFVFAAPPSWSAAKRARMRGAPHTFKPDLDNLLKLVLDALNPKRKDAWGAWNDDGQVSCLTRLEKHWCLLDEEEGTHVIIKKIGASQCE